MKTSAAGRALIEQREGRKLAAYRDTRGILTIGVGHTGRMAPPPVTPGMRITEPQCDAMLAADLAPVEIVINRGVTLPISQNEFDALASLGFNIGAGGLRKSSVVKRLNQGDVTGAAQAFMLWDHPAVLEGRRAAERTQFLTPDPVGHGVNIRIARADALTARATKIRDTAQAAHTTGAAAALTGTAAAAVAAHAHSAHLAASILALVAIGVGVDVFVAWHRHAMASSFAGNAERENAAAQSATLQP